MSTKLATMMNPAPHVGKVLVDDFLKPFGISAYRLAADLKIPASRVSAIINEERSCSALTAILLSHYFGLPPEYFLYLQMRHNLQVAGKIIGGAELKKLPVFDYGSIR